VKNSAFTLVELLVVIAVIAVLMGIALPSFRKVEENARADKCANNLSQIALAMFQFATDHNNSFPESGNVIPWGTTDTAPPQGSGQQSWMQQLGPYIGNPGDPKLSTNGSVFTCPSSSQALLTNGSTADQYYSYFNGAHAALAFTGKFGPVRRNSISHAAEQILSGDVTDWPSAGVVDADKDDYTQSPIDTISTFHNASINLLFADGHVESEKWNSSLSTPGYFDPSRMCTIYQGTGQVTYTGTAPGL
jgi:prepilin-type N-terminal cleavage/methylation domain-containing protein/prepilin-type processing-associated H-X9-DG protein